jgi:hypothetical protein
MSDEVQVGISFDIRGFITRACVSCGGVADRTSDAYCGCDVEPEVVPVTLHFTG